MSFKFSGILLHHLSTESNSGVGLAVFKLKWMFHKMCQFYNELFFTFDHDQVYEETHKEGATNIFEPTTNINNPLEDPETK